jgi:hypothetical protein
LLGQERHPKLHLEKRMHQTVETQGEILRDLGDGLILRRAASADAEALADFNGRIHWQTRPEEPDLRVTAWTRDLLARPHPTFQPGDFTLVEDTRTGQIISSLALIPQTWTYAGVPFEVGRPELVGTLAEYRHRGLVRAQFEVIHAWSAERGQLLQGITGIPYYYRLFGYEMAVDLGGGRAGFKAHIPRLPEGEAEPFRVRPAQVADLPFIAQLYEEGSRRSLLNCLRDEALWVYELNGKSADNVNRSELRLIETPEGEPVGFLAHPPIMWGQMLAATIFELKPGVPWPAVTPTVIRYLESAGEALVAQGSGGEPFESFGFWLHADHPVYAVLHDRLPRVRKPYAWYLRLPDLPGFLCHIRPVLEERLAGSPAAGYSGELQITFYRTGLRLVLEHGRLVSVETWAPEPFGQSGNAAFPGLTFLQLLFGYRSLEELTYAFPDCQACTDDAWALLNALFPKQASDIWPVS